MNKTLYFIKNYTSLFMGAGDLNYNIVDKEVERCPLTGQPMLHASGIKGAVRAHIEKTEKDTNKIEKAFGKGADSGDMGENSGVYKFMNAYLLYRPLRASGTDTYVKTTSIQLLTDYINIASSFGFKLGISIEDVQALAGKFGENNFISSYDLSNIEGESVTVCKDIVAKFKNLLGEKFAISKNLSEYDLPVIARNNLRSPNLWYEEYVPRESCFYFVLLAEGKCDIKVDEYLEDTSNPVQMGGNASVGYGYCKFEKCDNA